MRPQPAEPAPAVDRRPGPRFVKLYVEGLLNDPDLSDAEKLLLALILSYQRNSRRYSWASNEQIAADLGRNVDHIRRLIRQLNDRCARGLTQWRIASVFRPGRPGLRRVIIPAQVWISWRKAVAGAGGSVDKSGQKGGRMRPGPRAHAPTNKSINRSSPYSRGDGDLFDTAPRPFNLLAAAHRHAAGLAGALADAVRDGLVLFVMVDRRWRHLHRVTYDGGTCWLHVAVEGRPTQTEQLTVPVRQLGSWWFGR